MSWSVNAIGRSRAVAVNLELQFNRYELTEPEQGIRAGAARVVASALAAFGENDVVRVEASGSQTDGKYPGEKINTLQVSVVPVWGFLG